ncbi:DUF7010 family protein [Microbacterium sp.]|uniref:DUF7010 family protein n=1 Tax=Microbacterium sp. TaxID=51671 RepID=UPI003C732041
MSDTRAEVTQAPGGFGAAARDLAPFPAIMSGYAVFYAVSWPFAWGWGGGVALLIVLVAAALLVVRAVTQIRHAALFRDTPTPEIERERKAMTVLNSITHPVYLFPSILLIAFGEGRWVLPLMVFVIGAHFLPMARILDRKVDYVLGPVTMVSAIIAGLLALDTQVSWLVVFAVAGTGGAVSTLSYALYLAKEYRRLCVREGVAFPPREHQEHREHREHA